jgi:hypothetical protein
MIPPWRYAELLRDHAPRLRSALQEIHNLTATDLNTGS